MNHNQKRPIGVTLIALVFLWIGCLGTLFMPLVGLTGGTYSMWHLALGSTIHSDTWLKAIAHTLDCLWFLAYVAYAVIGFGLWKLKNWARKSVLGIAILGVIAVLGVATVFVRPFILGICVVGMGLVQCGWIAWYLMRPRVRYAFGAWNECTPAGERIEPPGLSRRGKLGIALLAPASLAVMFAIPLLIAVNTMMRNSGAYKLTMATAQASPCVTSELGSPLQAGWMISGSTEESSIEGSAELSIPVKGPKGKGQLDVLAKKLNGSWNIESLGFTHGSTRSNLIPAGASQSCR